MTPSTQNVIQGSPSWAILVLYIISFIHVHAETYFEWCWKPGVAKVGLTNEVAAIATESMRTGSYAPIGWQAEYKLRPTRKLREVGSLHVES